MAPGSSPISVCGKTTPTFMASPSRAEARDERIALRVDAADERRAEVGGHQQRAAPRALLEDLAPALARVHRVLAGEAVPLGMKDLDGLVEDVAAEHGARVARLQRDEH